MACADAPWESSKDNTVGLYIYLQFAPCAALGVMILDCLNQRTLVSLSHTHARAHTHMHTQIYTHLRQMGSLYSSPSSFRLPPCLPLLSFPLFLSLSLNIYYLFSTCQAHRCNI